MATMVESDFLFTKFYGTGDEAFIAFGGGGIDYDIKVKSNSLMLVILIDDL